MKKLLITAFALGAFALTAQAGLSLSLVQAEADLTQAWQSLSAQQRQELKASEGRWIRFKDSLGDAEKEDEVRARAAYLWSFVAKAQTRGEAISPAEAAKPEAAPEVAQLPAGLEEAIKVTLQSHPFAMFAGLQTIQYGNLLEAAANEDGIPIGAPLYPVRFVYPNGYIVAYFYQNEFGDWKHPWPVMQGSFKSRTTEQSRVSRGGLRTGVSDAYSMAGGRSN
jgi:hypothetical protein